MRYHSVYRMRPCIGAILLLTTLCAPVSALEVNPASIEFKTVKDTTVIQLTDGGQPVPASAVQSAKLYVGAHDYDHMITVSKADGALTVRPTEMLELGTYDLTIVTSRGTARVSVLALLQIVDNSLAARAARQGVSVDAIKEQLGISQPLGKERIDLNLPPLYYVGQALELKIPLKAGRSAMWSVNGTLKPAEGGTLRYVFEQPGIFDISYVEKEGNSTVAFGLGATTAAPEPAIPVTVEPQVQLTLRAPEGFRAFAWTADGKEAGAEATWSTTFTESGGHRVSVRASEPESDTAQAFRVVTYLVTVL
jgi:hypothetical protein